MTRDGNHSTEIEKAMQWERMSGERLSEAERKRIQSGERFVPPHMRKETTRDNPYGFPEGTPLTRAAIGCMSRRVGDDTECWCGYHIIDYYGTCPQCCSSMWSMQP